jgi:hypothetical protein
VIVGISTREVPPFNIDIGWCLLLGAPDLTRKAWLG